MRTVLLVLVLTAALTSAAEAKPYYRTRHSNKRSVTVSRAPSYTSYSYRYRISCPGGRCP